MEGARRRALAWTLAHDRERLESMLSLTELLVLGGGRLADLDAWGMSMLTTNGCLCSRLTPPGRWLTLSGRPALGVTAAGMADVNLQVADSAEAITAAGGARARRPVGRHAGLHRRSEADR